jgi:hypothetical protein
MYTNKLNVNNIKDLYWKEEYNIEDIAKKLGISFWSLYNFMNKNNISRRSTSEVNYVVNRIKPQFKIKENLSIAEEKLKIAGIMLYWAEGTLKGNTIDFTNSNPEMIKVFLKFLREVCGIKEERLRVYLYAYPCHKLEELKTYWRNITKVSLRQFTKPYIRNSNLNLSNRKLPYGLIHIRYNDKKLLEIIRSWIKEYINNCNQGAGTQAAKGDRLYKCSVLPKGRMEK